MSVRRALLFAPIWALSIVTLPASGAAQGLSSGVI